MKKKLLITGFDPFGGDSVNPSWEAVRLLPDAVGEIEVTKACIPTVFGKGADAVLALAKELEPDFIICVGLAKGRKAVTPEVVGINLREAGIADNEGNVPKNTSVVTEAPAAYFATLPVREMVEAIKAQGIPASLSFTAGAFVCNDVLYTLLHKYSRSSVQVGFIHVPFVDDGSESDVFSMPLEQVVAALEAAITTLDKDIR